MKSLGQGEMGKARGIAETWAKKARRQDLEAMYMKEWFEAKEAQMNADKWERRSREWREAYFRMAAGTAVCFVFIIYLLTTACR